MNESTTQLRKKYTFQTSNIYNMVINTNFSNYKMFFTISQSFGINYGNKTRLRTGNGTTIA